MKRQGLEAAIHRRSRLDDDGFTLAEIVVTIAILGIAVVALVAGIGASVSTTNAATKQATENAVLRNYAQTIRAQVAAQCVAPSTTYTTALTPSAPAGYSVSPALNTVENCPASGAAPASLPISVSDSLAAGAQTTQTTNVWLWLP